NPRTQALLASAAHNRAREYYTSHDAPGALQAAADSIAAFDSIPKEHQADELPKSAAALIHGLVADVYLALALRCSEEGDFWEAANLLTKAANALTDYKTEALGTLSRGRIATVFSAVAESC